MYAMYITAAVAAVGGNGIVCYLVLAYQRMRTVTNFFIVNLAIGDILMAALCIPFGFVSNLLLQHWPFGSIMCVVVSYSQAVSVFISAYTLIAISIDRYIAILYPLRPRMSKLQAKVIIGSVWLVAILTPMPTALLSKLDQPPAWLAANVTDKYICTEEWTNFTHRYYYSMALMVLQYFFPLAVLVFTYTRIAIVVWGKRTPGEAEDSRDRRMAASKRKVQSIRDTAQAHEARGASDANQLASDGSPRGAWLMSVCRNPRFELACLACAHFLPLLLRRRASLAHCERGRRMCSAAQMHPKRNEAQQGALPLFWPVGDISRNATRVAPWDANIARHSVFYTRLYFSRLVTFLQSFYLPFLLRRY